MYRYPLVYSGNIVSFDLKEKNEARLSWDASTFRLVKIFFRNP